MKSQAVLIILVVFSITTIANGKTFIPPGRFPAIGKLSAVFNSSNSQNLNRIKFHDESIKQKIIFNLSKNLPTYVTFCTATLISSQKLLTAAHCSNAVFSEFLQNGIKVVFRPNTLNRLELPVERLGEGNLAHFRIIEDWSTLYLKDSVVDVEPMKLVSLSNDELSKSSFLSIGFPEHVNGISYQNDYMFSTSCKSMPVDLGSNLVLRSQEAKLKEAISTNCELSNGDSGGPLLIKASRQAKDYFVVGIASSSLGYTTGSLFPIFNILFGKTVSLGFYVPAKFIRTELNQMVLTSELVPPREPFCQDHFKSSKLL